LPWSIVRISSRKSNGSSLLGPELVQSNPRKPVGGVLNTCTAHDRGLADRMLLAFRSRRRLRCLSWLSSSRPV
jgi:hypothetical protein